MSEQACLQFSRNPHVKWDAHLHKVCPKILSVLASHGTKSTSLREAAAQDSDGHGLPAFCFSVFGSRLRLVKL